MDRIHVYLSVYGFDPAPPALVSELLGIEPTRAWRKGEAVFKSPGPRAPSGNWELLSPLPRTARFEDQLEALLRILEEKAERVRLAMQRFGGEIGCAAYFGSTNPGFTLSADHISRIAALGLSLDFDLYCLASDADADAGS